MQRILNKDKRAADLLRRRPELLTDSMMVPAFTARSKRVQKRIEELFSSRDNLVSLMEILQREDWRQMRAYLTVLKEYLPVLDADKQDIILDFLYDMLSHQSMSNSNYHSFCILLPFTRSFPSAHSRPQRIFLGLFLCALFQVLPQR